MPSKLSVTQEVCPPSVPMKLPMVVLGLSVLLFFCGCVAFPVGKKDFTTEFATDVRDAPAAPTKEYRPSVTLFRDECSPRDGEEAPLIGVATSDGNVSCDIAALRHGTAIHEGAAPRRADDPRVGVAILYSIAASQPRERHYSSVTVTKRKMLAIGILPDKAEPIYQPQDALVPALDAYVGNGQYSSMPVGIKYDKAPGYETGATLCAITLGILPIPFKFLVGLFGPFESEHHYLGRQLESTRDAYGNIERTHSSADLELLAKFSPGDRRRIGAWTWRDNAEHPQNSFWHAFAQPLFLWPGVWKYCTYVVHEPVELERTTPEEPKRTVSTGMLQGPYRVFLEIPDAGFARTLAVPRGKEVVHFDLSPVADGRTGVPVRVRILPPSGGLEEAWDDDARTMLEMLSRRVITGTLDLPIPRLPADSDGGAGN